VTGRRATVRTPATSANLGPGFDSLGLCLDLADVVTAEVSTRGTEVEVFGEGAGEVPTDDSHLVVSSLRRALDDWGVAQCGVRVTCRNAIPHGRGLGSSAAAIVAGILLARELAGHPDVGAEQALPLASELEGHADNAAACLLGGLTITWSDRGVPSAVRLEVDRRVVPWVFCAGGALSTKRARAMLPEVVPHAAAAANAGRVGLLVEALTRRPELLLPATYDVLHQEHRRGAMPESLTLIDTLRTAGVAAALSGAGPSVLALGTAEQLAPVSGEVPPGWRLMSLGVDARGAQIVRTG
jgi:homoserine kinase